MSSSLLPSVRSVRVERQSRQRATARARGWGKAFGAPREEKESGGAREDPKIRCRRTCLRQFTRRVFQEAAHDIDILLTTGSPKCSLPHLIPFWDHSRSMERFQKRLALADTAVEGSELLLECLDADLGGGAQVAQLLRQLEGMRRLGLRHKSVARDVRAPACIKTCSQGLKGNLYLNAPLSKDLLYTCKLLAISLRTHGPLGFVHVSVGRIRHLAEDKDVMEE